MKKTIFTLFTLGFLGASSTYAQVGIGTQTPDASAILELESTEKGFLPPRMTTTERDAIINPEEGLTIYNKDFKCLDTYNGMRWVACNTIGAIDVYNPETGQIWMDRNLGASQVARSSTDSDSYGDLYQWGRSADGHEKRNSVTHSGSNQSDRPSTINSSGAWDGKFITIPDAENRNDWVQNQNDAAWNLGTQIGPIKTVTDPCPNGYRVPTISEWDAESSSWASTNASGAFDSTLNLPAAGVRINTTGLLNGVSDLGYYWSSTVVGTNSRRVFFSGTAVNTTVSSPRALGYSVRCIKE
jgi:uncharacterized protein (TIGR02145 family)